MRVLLKPLEWGIFANEFALLSSYAMIIGGFVAVVNVFPKWEIGVYSLITGLIVFILEYPRSYRDDSLFVERSFCIWSFETLHSIIAGKRCQCYFIPYLVAMGVFAKNFYMRSVFYLIFSVPCFFLLPTFIGASCIITASCIYLIAATHGFEWKQPPLKPVQSSVTDQFSTDNFYSLKETPC